MQINGYTNIYGLLGYPAKHSFSPLIHNYLFEKNIINAVYHVFEITPEEFGRSVMCLKRLNISGFNITMPYKNEIIPFLDEISEDAKILNSVNTVIRKEDLYKGFNTDISGFLRCLTENDFDFKNSSALVLGAGSTARSIVFGLSQKKIKKLSIFNRTQSRAFKMKDVFKIFFNNEITVLKDLNTVSEKKQKSFDLIINCTTVGMDGKNFAKGLPIPEDWNLKDKFVFEMIYKPFDTELLLKAKSEKAVTINGIDMLVSQALDSFEIWTGVHPGKKDLLKYVTDTLSRQ